MTRHFSGQPVKVMKIPAKVGKSSVFWDGRFIRIGIGVGETPERTAVLLTAEQVEEVKAGLKAVGLADVARRMQ